MPLLESWLAGLPARERAEAMADLVRLIPPAPEPKPRQPRAPAKPKPHGTNNMVRGSRTAVAAPSTRLEVVLDLDPDHLGQWLLRRASSRRLMAYEDDRTEVGKVRSVGGWNTPLGTYLRDTLGLTARVKDLILYLMIGDQEYLCTLPLWARKFVETCDAEPDPHRPIYADRALLLLQFVRDTKGTGAR